MGQRLLSLIAVCALSFAAFCQVQDVGDLSFAAAGVDTDAVSDVSFVAPAEAETVAGNLGCTRQRHAAAGGCSFDAVSALPAAVAPEPNLKPVRWRETAERLTKTGQIPDLRPPISAT